MIVAKSIELRFRDDLSRLPHSIGKMSQGGESVGLQGLDCSWCHAKILGPLILLKCASLSTSDVMAGPARRRLVGLRISLAFRLRGRIQTSRHVGNSYQMTCVGNMRGSNEGFQFMDYWQVSAPCHSIASGQSSCSHALPVHGSVVQAGRESTCRSGRADMPHPQNIRHALRQGFTSMPWDAFSHSHLFNLFTQPCACCRSCRQGSSRRKLGWSLHRRARNQQDLFPEQAMQNP